MRNSLWKIFVLILPLTLIGQSLTRSQSLEKETSIFIKDLNEWREHTLSYAEMKKNWDLEDADIKAKYGNKVPKSVSEQHREKYNRMREKFNKLLREARKTCKMRGSVVRRAGRSVKQEDKAAINSHRQLVQFKKKIEAELERHTTRAKELHAQANKSATDINSRYTSQYTKAQRTSWALAYYSPPWYLEEWATKVLCVHAEASYSDNITSQYKLMLKELYYLKPIEAEEERGPSEEYSTEQEYVPDTVDVVRVNPRNGEINVPFHSLEGEVFFKGSWDDKKMEDYRIGFVLEYKNDEGEMVKAGGVKERLGRSGNQLIFRFGLQNDLLDGVKYQARIHWEDKKKGNQTHNWTFSTAPDFEIKVKTIQVLEDQPLVKDKDTVIRVWALWKNPDPPVDPDWQVTESHLRINLELEELAGGTLEKSEGREIVGRWDSRNVKKYFPQVKGPNERKGEFSALQRKYDKDFVKWGLNAIDFFTYNPNRTGKRRVTAIVAPVPQSPFTPIRYYGYEDIEIRKQIRTLRFKYVVMAVGKWKKNTPRDFSEFIRSQHGYFKAILPVANVQLVETNPSQLEIFYPKWKANLLVDAAILQLGEYLDEYNEATIAEKIDRVIGIVPPGWIWSGVGASLPKRRFPIIDWEIPFVHSWERLATKYAVIVEDKTRPFVTTHEIGHTYGMAYEPYGKEHSDGLYKESDIKGYHVVIGKKEYRSNAIIGYREFYEDFMGEAPHFAWIAPQSYQYLLSLFTEK